MTREEAIEKYCDSALDKGIPAHMINGLVYWIIAARPPGSFLQCVLENDLAGAIGKADRANRSMLFNYVDFLYNVAPTRCWHSTENVAQWKGLFPRGDTE